MRIILLTSLVILISSCYNDRKKKLQPIADVVKKHYMSKLSDVDRIDTLYLTIDSITEKKQTEMLANEYLIKGMEIQLTKKPFLLNYKILISPSPYDSEPVSPYFKAIYDSLIFASESLDSTTLKYYRVSPYVLFRQKNMHMAYAGGTQLFFDKEFHLISKKSILEFVSEDSDFPIIDDYKPFTSKGIENMKNNGTLKYF